MPAASATLFFVSTSKCTCVRWMLMCTIRKSPRLAATRVAARIA